MSVPVRCSANVVVADNICDTMQPGSIDAETRRDQWMSNGGRLGTPDAATEQEDDQQQQQVLRSLDIKQQSCNQRHPQQSQQQLDDVLSSEELFAKLQEALSLEGKFQPNLYFPQESQAGEITVGARDGAAHVLRCLKVWYELPTDVLFAAVNLVDRFLAKMKVKPKHMACISVGSFHLAIKQLQLALIDPEDLVAISQCRCTAGDLDRMSGIIANKLGVQIGVAPITSLTFLRLYYHIFKHAADQLGLASFYEQAVKLPELEMRLEILACDASCTSIRSSELALVLICTQMDAHVSNILGNETSQIHGLVDYAIQLQKLCRIPDSTFFHSHSIVVEILSRYNGQHKMPYRQRLVWKLSSRTMRVLRPTDKLTSYLPTIEEHKTNNSVAASNLSRFRTGSVSSEEGEDWPTSPVIPVFEQC